MTEPETWAAPVARGPVDATVRVPGSKSLTNRWLVLAALAEGPSLLHDPLRSQDSRAMVEALEAEIRRRTALQYMLEPITAALRRAGREH